jgi:hypothetical protein
MLQCNNVGWHSACTSPAVATMPDSSLIAGLIEPAS